MCSIEMSKVIEPSSPRCLAFPCSSQWTPPCCFRDHDVPLNTHISWTRPHRGGFKCSLFFPLNLVWSHKPAAGQQSCSTAESVFTHREISGNTPMGGSIPHALRGLRGFWPHSGICGRLKDTSLSCRGQRRYGRFTPCQSGGLMNYIFGVVTLQIWTLKLSNISDVIVH